MTATVIPFPKAPRGSLGTLEVEMGRLAVAVHLRALRKGRPSSYEQALDCCKKAWAEVQRERLQDPTPLPGEPGFARARPLPGKGDLVRMVKKRAQAKRAARKPPEGAR